MSLRRMTLCDFVGIFWNFMKFLSDVGISRVFSFCFVRISQFFCDFVSFGYDFMVFLLRISSDIL